jgi:autotransporter-associated beta strand protein
LDIASAHPLNKGNSMLARRSLFSTLAVLMLTSPALSVSIPIPIPNGSFEAPTVNGAPYATPNISVWQKSPPPAWWTNKGYTSDQWNNAVGTFVNVPYEWIDNLDPSGGTSVHQQAAFMFADLGLQLSQTLSTTYQVGASYQLTVGIEGGGYGMPLGVPMQIELYYLDSGGNQAPVGTTTILNDNTTLPISHLPDRVLTITAIAASDPWAGQNIGVALVQTAGTANSGGYWDIDNVRLVAITTPTAVWTGAAVGNTNWSYSGNWSGEAAAGTALSFANPGSGHTQNTNDFPAGTSFAGITFAAGSPAYNLQGRAIQLSGAVANQSSVNQMIGLDMQVVAGGSTFDSGSGSMTITGAISGSAVTKVGAGSLVLSGSNSYTGGTSVLDGTLVIATADALPTGSSLTIGADAQQLFGQGLSPAIETAGSSTDVNGVSPVPEPGTLVLLAVGAAATGIVCSRFKMHFASGWYANNRIWKFGG